jgi:glyoxylate carboligase
MEHKGNIADLLVRTLEAAGVRRIYGIVGDSLNGVTEALRVHGHIDWVHVRNEEVARPIEAEQVKGLTLWAIKAVLDGRGAQLIDLARTNLFR